MTKRFAGRLAGNRCECAAAADHTQIGGAAGDASEEATRATCCGAHAHAAMPDGQQ